MNGTVDEASTPYVLNGATGSRTALEGESACDGEATIRTGLCRDCGVGDTARRMWDTIPDSDLVSHRHDATNAHCDPDAHLRELAERGELASR